MGTLNDIFKKIEDKTELSSHQVELANINDLKKLTAQAKKSLDAYNKSNDEAKKIARITLQKADEFQNDRVKMYDVMQVIEKQAKELGLDITSTPDFKLAVDLFVIDRDVESQKGYLRQVI
jgi:hypothetical protein